MEIKKFNIDFCSIKIEIPLRQLMLEIRGATQIT